MISPERIFNIITENGTDFFTGVPDSLLKDFCSYVTDNVSIENHIISSNEGTAVALAAGKYLASGKAALVYMQNSGLGNAVNPLLSLADKEVYGIPMLLVIGWRGEPGKKDEPQHIKQGRVMLKMLESMEIPYEIINSETIDYEKKIESLYKFINKNLCHAALIISEGTFEEYKLKSNLDTGYKILREDAVKMIIDNISEDDIIVSTTGKTSREVFEYRDKKGQEHKTDFLTVGSMGHSSMIALGISLMKKSKQVFVLDGDGAVIMQMGSLAIAGTNGGNNFKHILINNGVHDSVGGQPTAGFDIDFTLIAKGCGYMYISSVYEGDQIKNEILKLRESKGPSFLEIKVNKGARKDLGRPSSTPKQNKEILMRFLKG